MQLEVLTPDQELFKGRVDGITLPGLDGYFGILDHHASLISALTEGTVTLKGSKEAEGSLVNKKEGVPESFDFSIQGGMVEVKDNHVILLAD